MRGEGFKFPLSLSQLAVGCVGENAELLLGRVALSIARRLTPASIDEGAAFNIPVNAVAAEGSVPFTVGSIDLELVGSSNSFRDGCGPTDPDSGLGSADGRRLKVAPALEACEELAFVITGAEAAVAFVASLPPVPPAAAAAAELEEGAPGAPSVAVVEFPLAMRLAAGVVSISAAAAEIPEPITDVMFAIGLCSDPLE